MPQLIAKQAHILMRFMNNLTPTYCNDRYVSVGPFLRDAHGRGPRGFEFPCIIGTINGTTYNLFGDGLHALIYPHWDPSVLVCPKSPSLIFSNRDQWMWRDHSNLFGQNYYHYGFLHLREIVRKSNPDMWWEFTYDPSSGVPYSGGLHPLTNVYNLQRKMKGINI